MHAQDLTPDTTFADALYGITPEDRAQIDADNAADEAWHAVVEAKRTEQVEVTYTFGLQVERLFMQNYDRFAKTCARFGQPLAILNREVIEVPHRYVKDQTVRRVQITVSIPPVAGEKGRVLGRFERAEDGKQFYVEVTDERFRAEVEALKGRAGECDHCGQNRDRNQTFVCETSEGVKLVGRSCLRDFFGMDPAKTLAFWQGLDKFKAEEWGAGGGSNLYDVDFAVRQAYRVARRFGGYSKDSSIKHAALLVFGNHGFTAEERRYNKEIIDSYAGFEPEFDAEGFADYIVNLRPSDFADTLRIILEQDYANSKRFGTLVAGVGLSVGAPWSVRSGRRTPTNRPSARPPCRRRVTPTRPRVSGSTSRRPSPAPTCSTAPAARPASSACGPTTARTTSTSTRARSARRPASAMRSARP